MTSFLAFAFVVAIYSLITVPGAPKGQRLITFLKVVGAFALIFLVLGFLMQIFDPHGNIEPSDM